MNAPTALHHKKLAPPAGKQPDTVVGERHEIVLLFDCAKSNPNGDPDTGNMPRVQPDTLRGLVTDVCLKRKVRNFFSLYNPHSQQVGAWNAEDDRQGYDILIREGAVLQRRFDPKTGTDEGRQMEELAKKIFVDDLKQDPKAWDAKKKTVGKKNKKATPEDETEETSEPLEVSPAEEQKRRAYHKAVCQTFLDVRAFGAVLSTEGPLKGSFYGQIRGPLQFTFSESLDKVLAIDATITRCAVASVDEAKKKEASESGDSRTMGRKHGIDYGLYRCSIHLSAAFAAKTGFSYYDLDNFLFALEHMFDDDHAAGRHLRLVGLVDFQHQSALGNAPAHKLFEMVKVEGIKESGDGKMVFKSSGSEFPQGLHDYRGSAPGGTDTHTPVPGYEGKVAARKLVWEVPECSTASAAG